MNEGDTGAVFDGLRVVDLSGRLSGAFCARLFGDWGADVALVESPEGHALRWEPPFLDGDTVPEADRSLLHAYANANKRSAVVAANEPDTLIGLFATADVVVTTDGPARLAELPPIPAGAVHISVTPHGLDGPLADAPGDDLTAYARSSWALLNGDPGEPPLKGSHNQTGYMAGLIAFVAGAAAVLYRGRTGQGQLVDVSELETTTVTAGPAILQAVYAGAVAPRRPADLLRGPVPCKDGYFSLTISRAQFWRDAMNVLGLHDLAEDERYASSRFRHEQRDVYSERVEGRIREWDRWDLFDALATVRCVAGVVQDTRDVAENEHLAARDFFVPVELPDGRTVQFPGAPFKLPAAPWVLRSPAPRLGEGGPHPPTPSPTRGEGAHGDSGSPIPKGRERSLTSLSYPKNDGTPLSPRGRGVGGEGSGPLAGVRAVVLTQAWSGTFATELLGFLGAEVIQVEARRRPDSWRGDYNGVIPPALRDPDRRQRPWNLNGLYNSVNLNKRAITLDLQQPRGIELFRALVPHADLVAENFTPRVMGNLGLDFAALSALRPGIILASLSAYGASGPYANVPGIGGTIEPMSGMSALLGYEGGRPQNSGAMYPDPVSGAYFAAAMIMALHRRDRTGEGAYIDLGMMEACATFTGDALLEYTATGRVRPRMGNRHPRVAPHNIYAARNGDWLALACHSDTEFVALCRVMGCPGLANDARFATKPARKAHEHELDALVSAWAATQNAGDAARALLEADVPAARAAATLDAMSDPQMAARGFFEWVEHPEAGRQLQAGIPFRLSRTPVRVERHAPMLGEHSREVFAELLSMSDAEYENLVSAGITGDMPPD